MFDSVSSSDTDTPLTPEDNDQTDSSELQSSDKGASNELHDLQVEQTITPGQTQSTPHDVDNLLDLDDDLFQLGGMLQSLLTHQAGRTVQRFTLIWETATPSAPCHTACHSLGCQRSRTKSGTSYVLASSRLATVHGRPPL